MKHFYNLHLDIGNVIDRRSISNEMNILAVCSFGEVLQTRASWPPNFLRALAEVGGGIFCLIAKKVHLPGPDSTSIAASCPWISLES